MITLIRRRSRLLSATLTSGAIAFYAAQPAVAGEVGDAIRTLADTTAIHEAITLRDIGLDQEVALGSNAASREIYIPVPAGVPLTEPVLSVKGRYIRGDGGRTTYTLSLDGNLVAARSPTDESGTVDLSIGVDGAPRPTGFVRMGLNWSSVVGQSLCGDERIIGNALEISPDSRLEYTYDPSSVKDIASVWAALPRKVTLLISSDAPDSTSYDAAWRLGVALERAGKEVVIATPPKVGSVVDVSGLEIPPALASIPAFASLARGGTITLANDAEAGALLLLNASGARANVAVADAALAGDIKAALDAVRQQLSRTDPDAGSTLDALYGRANSLFEPAQPKSVEVRTLAGRPVITVAPDAAASASGLFDSLWRRTAVSGRIVLNTIGKPASDSDRVRLGSLDEVATSLDVVARGDWTTTFDLGASLIKGKVPADLDIYVTAAPGAANTLPVASVFINDYLLGAKQLTADGRPERVTVDIPSYALLPRNTLRVQFQRQPASDRCRETPQAYPVAVLPNSNMRLKDAPSAKDFATLVPELAGDALVVVPESWRRQAGKTLSTVIRVASATGVSPADAEFSIRADSATVTAQKPFLAFDVPVEGATDVVKVNGDHVSIADGKGNVFYDVAGASNIAVLQAVTGGKFPGVSWHTVGEAPRIEKAFLLSRGDIAVIGDKGLLASASSTGAPLYLNADGTQGGGDGPFTWSKLLDPAYLLHNITWLLTIGLVVILAILLVLAQRSRRRANSDRQ